MKILYIAWSVPYPTNVGGRQRTNLLHRALSEIGDVDLIALNDPSRYTEEQLTIMRDEFGLIAMEPITLAGKQGFWRYFYRLSPRWVNRIAHNWNGSKSLYQTDHSLLLRLGDKLNLDQYDLVVGRYAKSLAKLGLPDGETPTLLDVDDLDSDAYQSRIDQLGQSFLARLQLRRHLRNIREAQFSFLKRVKHLWVANPENLEHAELKHSELLQNIPFVATGEPINQTPVGDESLSAMTIASYNHRPNVEGVDWFLQKVWPVVLQKQPKAVFNIYGSQMSDELRARWAAHPGVNAIGFVEYVADAYRECALAVCPVLSGAGTNIKVLEAGMHNRMCVVTRVASRGFAALGEYLSVCDDAHGMAEAIVNLLSDRESNRAQAEEFAEAVKQRYSYEHFSKVVKHSVEAVLR
jgi:glycosyltransferase involved in cell wall biosynthesis